MPEQPPVVVTISRQLASGGAYIGQRVAQQLHLRYVDREILRQAADALGCADDEDRVASLEERSTGWWGWMSRAVSVGPPDEPFVPPPPPRVDEADVRDMETRIIREIAASGQAVIVGRGAAHVIPPGPGMMRVFVHAPVADRCEEIRRTYHLDEAAAREMVRRSDRDRARFVESLVGRPWTDAALYDLCVNTAVIPRDLAVALIVNAINARR